MRGSNGPSCVCGHSRTDARSLSLNRVLQAPQAVVARRPVVAVRAAAEAEAVSVSDVGTQEAVAHLRFQRGSVHKVRSARAMCVVR